jgi:hypothetical protein
MSMEHWRKDINRVVQKNSARNLSQWHLFHNVSHGWAGIRQARDF